jgi:hypothetical protein
MAVLRRNRVYAACVHLSAAKYARIIQSMRMSIDEGYEISA